MTIDRYSRSAMLLHWAIALLLAFQLSLGWRLEDMPRGPGLFSAYQLHKSVGIFILLLTLARIAIRLLHKRPPLPVDSPWAQRLAKLVHFGLYAVMLGGPLTGWALVSTAKLKVPTLVFQVLPWPHLPIPDNWNEPAKAAHALLAILGVLLFLMHVAGALRHQFIKGEPLLHRMLPLASTKPALMAFAALGLIGAALVAAKQWSFPNILSAPSKAAAEAPVAFDQPKIALEDKAQALKPDEVQAKEGEAQAQLDTESKTKLPEDEPLTLKAGETMAAAAPVSPAAPTGPIPLSDWQIAPGGRLGFQASWAGIPIEGRFNNWTGRIKFSPDALDKTDIAISINLASADTQDSQRDSNLRGADFFNTGTYSEAVFTAKSARKTSPDRYVADGTLNLHGVTRPVAVHFTLKISGNNARVSGGTSLDRLAYGVGSGEYAKTDEIAGNVPVNFSFQANRR